MFAGKSSLRSDEPEAPRLVNKELQDYLAKYNNSGAVDNQKKKKKKKPKAVYAGVKVVDNDVSGFAANTAGDDEEDEDDCAHFCHPALAWCMYFPYRASTTVRRHAWRAPFRIFLRMHDDAWSRR